jgi:hypothetical protein
MSENDKDLYFLIFMGIVLLIVGYLLLLRGEGVI